MSQGNRQQQSDINTPLDKFDVHTKSRKTENNNIQPHEKITDIQHQQQDFICSLCLRYIVRAVTTVCGHSFCSMCLSEHLIFFAQCIKCSHYIEDGENSFNRVLDSLIEYFIMQNHNEVYQQFIKRMSSYKTWQVRRRPQSFDVGLRVDLRDKNNIWCQGRITRIFMKGKSNRDKKQKFLVIKYMNTPKDETEQLSQHSNRIATNGFYTNRVNIPHYQIDQKGFIKRNRPLEIIDQKLGGKVYMRLEDQLQKP